LCHTSLKDLVGNDSLYY